jgi:hypothetical protein
MDIMGLINYCRRNNWHPDGRTAYQLLAYYVAVEASSSTITTWLLDGKGSGLDLFRDVSASTCIGTDENSRAWFYSHTNIWGRNGAKLVRLFCQFHDIKI